MGLVLSVKGDIPYELFDIFVVLAHVIHLPIFPASFVVGLLRATAGYES